MIELNHTHDPLATSWLSSAQRPGTDFPIQNLPFAVFQHMSGTEPFRGGVAIGDQVIDLALLAQAGVLEGLAQDAARACSLPVLNNFMGMGPAAWRALRHALFDLLKTGAEGPAVEALRLCLVPQIAVRYQLPAHVRDYTDFYTSIHHAANIGKLFRGDDNVLTPNFQWMPIAYHGRSSSLGVSGQTFPRPMGQALPPGASQPVYGPCQRMDYELELGFFVGPGNPQGSPIPLAEAESHVFGVCLLNDWSARDIQAWEYQPLGPFLGKNFATTISPWVVTLEALAPFRQAWDRPADHPQPLPYLEGENNRARGALDIQLQVAIESAAHRAGGHAPAPVSHTSFRHQYWTLAQMVTHHTMGGCNLQPGDLLGSGTISGPTLPEAGAMIELTRGGREPLNLRSPGAADETRGFLQDGDTVILRGWCEKPGCARIGFGEARGTVLPALSA